MSAHIESNSNNKPFSYIQVEKIRPHFSEGYLIVTATLYGCLTSTNFIVTKAFGKPWEMKMPYGLRLSLLMESTIRKHIIKACQQVERREISQQRKLATTAALHAEAARITSTIPEAN